MKSEREEEVVKENKEEVYLPTTRQIGASLPDSNIKDGEDTDNTLKEEITITESSEEGSGRPTFRQIPAELPNKPSCRQTENTPTEPTTCRKMEQTKLTFVKRGNDMVATNQI